jgi:hypothetical protein
MQRIDTLTKAVDLFGAGKHGFKDGNLAGGIAPTDLNATWFNLVQEELLAVIEAAGLAPNGATLNQLLLALRAAGVFTTPAQFDNTTKAATTAFVQRALGNYQGVITNTVGGATVLTAADMGKEIVVSGSSVTGSVVLPPLASVSDGAAVLVKSEATTSTWTVAANAADGAALIPISTGVASFALKRGDFALVSKSGAFWRVHGTASLGLSDSFANSLAPNGSQLWPSGSLFQWGSVVTSASADVAVTFPTAFPAAVYSFVPGVDIAPGNLVFANFNSLGLATCNVGAYNTSGARVSTTVRYQAIGK